MAGPTLYINSESWHYKYFTFLRGIWGWEEHPKITSLCPYCQTMFWLSVSTVLAAPIFAFGWVFMKFIMIASVVGDLLVSDAMIGRIEGSYVAQRANNMAHRVENSPALGYFTAGVALIIFSASMICLSIVASMGLGALIYSIPQWPGAIWFGLTTAGYYVFWACAWVGALMDFVAGKAVWLFTNGPLWSSIGYWAGLVGGIATAFALTCFVGYKILMTKPMMNLNYSIKGWFDRISHRMTQRAEARMERRLVIVQQREQAGLEEVAEPRPVRDLASSIWGFFKKCGRGVWHFFFSRQIRIGDGVAKIMSPFSIMYTFMWAMKHRMCPIVQVIDEADLEAQAIQEMEREEAAERIAEMDDAEVLEQQLLEQEEPRVIQPISRI